MELVSYTYKGPSFLKMWSVLSLSQMDCVRFMVSAP